MSTPLLVSPPVTRRLGLAGLGLATLLPMLAGSMANLVLPALGQDFGVPFASLQWVLVAYLLGITSLTVVAGRLGDRLGRRRLLLWGDRGLCAGFPAVRPGPFHWLAHCRSHPARGGCGLHAGALAGHGRRAGAASPTGLEHGIAWHPVGLRHGARPLLRRPVDRRIWLAGSLPAAAPPDVAGAGVCLAGSAPG